MRSEEELGTHWLCPSQRTDSRPLRLATREGSSHPGVSAPEEDSDTELAALNQEVQAERILIQWVRHPSSWHAECADPSRVLESGFREHTTFSFFPSFLLFLLPSFLSVLGIEP